MSKKIENLTKHRNKKKPATIEEAARRAARRFRDMTPTNIEEPEALASGDMKKFLENPDEYEKGEDDEWENES
ncbi:MAG: hypothetical protein ACR2PX_09455 [Endozoicomonas sp.]|uniref:hypothetical protein n=1 Tax=Endozoicomonas sp. TaxID=1892382 RepID=UPI003D9AFAD6